MFSRRLFKNQCIGVRKQINNINADSYRLYFKIPLIDYLGNRH